MIRVDVSETFPIIVSLVDESTGTLATAETVTYDVRDSSDNPLSPPINGTMTESTVASGIYKATATINTSGNYVVYASATGYNTNTEEIIVNPENVYDLVKQSRHYNIGVKDVVRTSAVPTASQAIRNVPYAKTDFVITKIKSDTDPNWSGPTTPSGVVYAWYNDVEDLAPYKMDDSGV